ncbi:MAG TPA: Uma2 family endonuclease [Egibacteraceae bacterium]|nr:Uma2 family endonuclease [Egibacteraceae bacterium]
MGHDTARRWTAEEFLALPEDDRRIELFDGVIVVTPSAVSRHELVIARISFALMAQVDPLGGVVFGSSLDTRIDDRNVLQPDVQVFLPGHVHRIGPKFVEGPADLVAEVSSPKTKGRDRVRKRALYEGFGVAEFWIVDLDEDVIEVYRLHDGGYAAPQRLGHGDTVTTPLLPGWSAEVDWLLPDLP